jgi:PPK2 family polyphosphate:nucleotide phosphotransferase
MTSLRDSLRLAPGAPVDLSAIPTDATVGIESGKKRHGKKRMRKAQDRLSTLQTRLFAEGSAGSPRRVVVVLQGLDTSGKGGTIKRVAGPMNPSGVRVTAFGAPTEEEKAEHFLERVERAVPVPGKIGIFDRSHYEDVLIARVEGLVEEREWRGRFDEINDFEADLAVRGVTLLKVFLHLSYDEQRERLLARLDDPDKHWKLDPSDLDNRRRWPDYQEAYAEALQRCSSESAPWHVVPADRKWYSRFAVCALLAETLEAMDPQLPRPDHDVCGLRQALADPC